MRFLQYLLFTSLLTSAFSQDPLRVRSLSTLDGLSQNSITQILEDEDGYIWLSTQDGLNRYNGYDFRSFRPDPDDPFSLGDNFVIQMILGPDGRLWLNTREGISVYDKVTGRFYKIVKPPQNPVRQFYQMQKVGDRIYVIDYYDNFKIQSIPVAQAFSNPYTVIDSIANQESPNIESPLVLFETYNDFWILGLNEGLRVSDGARFPIPDSTFFYTSAETWDHEQISEDQVLISHPNKLILLHTDRPWIEVLSDSIGVFSFQPFGRSVIIGTNQGLKLFDPITHRLSEVTIEGQSFETSIIHHLFQDSFGQLWIGTANQGAFIHQPNTREFIYLKNNALSDQQLVVWDALKIQNTWYLGTDVGLMVFEENTYNRTLLEGRKILSLAFASSKTLYAGAQNGDLFELDLPGMSLRKVSETTHSPVTSLLINDQGLMIGTHKGLGTFRNGYFQLVDSDRVLHPQTYIFELFVDKGGRLWVATAAGVYYRSKKGEIISIPYKKGDPRSMNFNFVSGFAEDVNGALWMATYGGGVSRMNEDSTFTHFTEKDGLPNNVIHAICSDDQGFLWLTSNGGLTRFDPLSYETLTFTTLEGLKSNNFAISAITKADSTVAVGTTNGLLLFSPNKVRPLSSPPRILWEDIRINYRPMQVGQPVNSLHEVRLNPGDKVISLELSGIKLDHPSDVQYAHQLEGFSPTWVPLSQGSRIISYSSLPYGTYQLHVRASSQNRHFAPIERVLTIKVVTPFWFTWWFIALTQVLIVALVIGAVFYFSRRNLKRRLRELETEARIQAERHRISQDLHDSVGTHFAYIISKLDYLFLSWGKEDVIQDKKSYLQSLSDFARSGMRLLRETIWALDAPHVSSLSLKSKIGDYLKFCLTDSSLQYTFDFTSSQESLLSSEALHCFRIIQEAVSNSLKHACAKTLSVTVRIFPAGFEVVIADDGKGFSQKAAKVEETYGLKSMKKRCEELGASLEIESGNGTKIRVLKESPK